MTLENFLLFIIASFAVYRVSRMIAVEDGPLSCFALLRGWVYSKRGNGWMNDGINCPLCLSFWIAIPFALTIAPINLTTLIVWLGLSGVASFLYMREKSK